MGIYSNANIVFNLVQFIAYLIVLAISQNDHIRFLLVFITPKCLQWTSSAAKNFFASNITQ